MWREANSADVSKTTGVRQRRFLALLPAIEQQARYAFHGLTEELREELIQEVRARSWLAYDRLCELDKPDIAYPTPLAQYAIRQICDGRRVGAARNVRDVTSPYGRQRSGICLQSLDQLDSPDGEWKELAVEDKRATPAEVAAARIDFAEWLATLSVPRRQIAETLATGETTRRAAQIFCLTPGRISQLRREFRHAWRKFQGLDAGSATA